MLSTQVLYDNLPDKAPPLIMEALLRLPKLSTNPDEILPTLRFLRKKCKKTDKNRQIRSERRDGLVEVCEYLVKHYDMSSSTVGRYQPHRKSIKSLSLETLANAIGFGLRRVERIIRELKHAGYLSFQRVKKQTLDGYRERPAIKFLTQKFFLELGIKMSNIKKWCQWHKERRGVTPDENLKIIQQLTTTTKKSAKAPMQPMTSVNAKQLFKRNIPNTSPDAMREATRVIGDWYSCDPPKHAAFMAFRAKPENKGKDLPTLVRLFVH